MLRKRLQEISGWGNVPRQSCWLIRPEKMRELFSPDLWVSSPAGSSIIARGQGRSYGDASLNHEQTVAVTQRLNRFIEFDITQGILSAESGTTLQEILAVIIPAGWFLPVTPGTQKVSLGGCAATDVHGKNHHKVGSFGQHIISLQLITAQNQIINCSTQENSDLFWATIGGMGLTGFISAGKLQLIPISSTKMAVKHLSAPNLEKTFELLTQPDYDDDYSVAWIDTYRQRSIVMTAHHALADEIKYNQYKSIKTSLSRNISMPCYLPNGFLNTTIINLFNQFYFYTQSKKLNNIINYDQYFYPCKL